MLQNTFCHIPGIGLKTETRIWEKGIYSWKDFYENPPAPGSIPRRAVVDAFIEQSVFHLGNNNPSYFAALLPAPLHWRLFPAFRNHTAYIDIETTGLASGCDITTIALYDGTDIRCYVAGQNLEDFLDDIFNYTLIVTYNGKGFDLPFLEHFFKTRFPHAHIDLRHVLSSLGYKGGLKSCERQMGISRGDLSGVDGYFAVLLWAEYERTGNVKALETLLAYNIEDVVNLEVLMIVAYNLKIKGMPFFNTLEIPLPQPPAIPFQPDLKIIDKIRSRLNQI
jgi:uncharacterized protein YprB with RNaseH-like and TPR domain